MRRHRLTRLYATASAAVVGTAMVACLSGTPSYAAELSESSSEKTDTAVKQEQEENRSTDITEKSIVQTESVNHEKAAQDTAFSEIQTESEKDKNKSEDREAVHEETVEDSETPGNIEETEEHEVPSTVRDDQSVDSEVQFIDLEVQPEDGEIQTEGAGDQTEVNNVLTESEEDTENMELSEKSDRAEDDLPEPEIPEEEINVTVAEAFTGITIDGDISDWNAVAKTAVTENNYGALTDVAVIQDDEYIYIYMADTGNAVTTWSGPYSNGRFSFVSDLGRTTMFQLKRGANGSFIADGIDGALCAYSYEGWGYPGYWEIAVPKSELAESNGTYSFGFYQALPLVTDIVVSSGEEDPEEEAGNFSGIVYDGLYGDWKYYPHTRIDYATAGTSDAKVDGEGALYSSGSTLYGHCITRMRAQINQRGEEMLYGVKLRVNQNSSQTMELRFVTVNAAGNINWNPDTSNLENGTYEFYIVDVAGWSNAPTLADLKEYGNNNYGRMYLTVGDTTNECELKMDLEAVAERFGMEATDLQVLEMQYLRIGTRWLQTAGASSGAVPGILGCILVSGAVLARRKKKGLDMLCL